MHRSLVAIFSVIESKRGVTVNGGWNSKYRNYETSHLVHIGLEKMSWVTCRKTNDLLKSEQAIGLVCGTEQKRNTAASVTVLYTFVETVRDFVCLSVVIRLSIQRNRGLSVVLCTVFYSARYGL